jgi:methionyl-tRNA formyltransferase
MAIIFFGTPKFAVPSLKALIDNNEDVVLVVTQPDKFKGRGHILSAPPIKEFALSYGIRVMQPDKIKDEAFYKELLSIAPEFIVVVAYGKILPKEILSIPKYGCINVHASLLPKYRGAAPIQWALINGDKITGITTILMDEGLDTGDILLQSEIEIKDSDNFETLSKRLSELGADILIKTLSGIRTGSIKPVKQQGEATYAPPLKKEAGRINWNNDAEKILNLVRALNPWPSTYCYLNNERIKILKVSLYKADDLNYKEVVPGRIVKASKGVLIVETAKGLLSIEEIQPEGKKAMSAVSFLSGRRLREGYDKFS